MKKICVHCNKEFDEATKKCSECGKRLKVVFTKEEQEFLDEIYRENEKTWFNEWVEHMEESLSKNLI